MSAAVKAAAAECKDFRFWERFRAVIGFRERGYKLSVEQVPSSQFINQKFWMGGGPRDSLEKLQGNCTVALAAADAVHHHSTAVARLQHSPPSKKPPPSRDYPVQLLGLRHGWVDVHIDGGRRARLASELQRAGSCYHQIDETAFNNKGYRDILFLWAETLCFHKKNIKQKSK